MGANPDISRVRGVHLKSPLENFYEIFGLTLFFDIYHPQIIENAFKHFLFILY